jgi:hypothetical protein
MPRSRNPRDKLPSQRGAKRTGSVGTVLPGDDSEVARDIQRIWWEIEQLKRRPTAVVVEGGATKPRIIDYFDNSAFGVAPEHIAPDVPTARYGPSQSKNWVVWSEQANWSGYDSPEPWIAVDDVTTGDDTYGDPINCRWVFVPAQGTATDFESVGGAALVRVQFMLDLPTNISDQWWDVTVFRNDRNNWPDGTPWDDGDIGDTVNGNYGWRSDFPVASAEAMDSTIGSYRRRPSLEFYQQVSGGTYVGFGVLLTQSFPTGVAADDFEQFPYCQMIVEIVKDYAFEGERTA